MPKRRRNAAVGANQGTGRKATGNKFKPPEKPKGPGQNQAGGGKQAGGKQPGGKTRKRNQGGIPAYLQEDPLVQAQREADLAEQIAARQAGESTARIQSIYGTAQGMLGAGQGYDATAQGIASDMGANIAGLSGLIGTATPATEQGAAGAMLATLGSGGQQLLAADRMRNLNWQDSSIRQAALEPMVAGRQINHDLDSYLEDLRSGMFSRADELRESRLSQILALKEWMLRRIQEKRARKSDKALRGYLLDEIGAGGSGGKRKAAGGGNR